MCGYMCVFVSGREKGKYFLGHKKARTSFGNEMAAFTMNWSFFVLWFLKK